MRNMSFSLTTPQFIDGTKDITRRFGWWQLKPGDLVRAVKQSMGLSRGEKIQPLGVIEIISARAESLNAITKDDCRREGFPHFSPIDFIKMLTEHYGVKPTAICNRIEFKKVKS